TPENEVRIEKVTTTQSIDEKEAAVLVEKEKTIINEEEDIIVEKKAVIVPASEVSEKTEEALNIANTQAVEEEKPETPKEEQKPEEPMDEFARLKARLDKAVYASDYAKKKAEEEKPAETAKKETPTAAANTTKPVYYTVKKGDSAFAIAKKHGITMTQLKEWNHLDFNEIKIGQKLRVK